MLGLRWLANPCIVSFVAVVLEAYAPLFFFLTCLTGCLSWAAVGKHSPPSVALWRWITSKTCVLTAFSRRYTMIPRTKMMRWATPTPFRTICMRARWASNLSLLAMTVMTSSYQSYGHLKKILTYRRSNWDLRGDPGTRRYKVSGLLIIVTPKTDFRSCFTLSYIKI